MEKAYFHQIIEKFNREAIKYILIGRQAVVLYGFPVISFDFDLWIQPEDRDKVFSILLAEDFEPSSDASDRKPIVIFIKDVHKIDVFFVRGFGKLKFQDCYDRANIFSEGNFSIRVASPEEIIYLKSFRRPIKNKDKEDIKFLQKLINKKEITTKIQKTTETQ